ncbi:hypothetical protein L9F63_020727, partial [Diploptera punctata]
NAGNIDTLLPHKFSPISSNFSSIVDCRSGRSKLTSSRTSGWQSEMRTRRERCLTGETP